LVSQKEAAACDLCPGIFRSRRAMRLHRQRCSQRAQLHTAAAQSSQPSAAGGGQRHDRQAGADHDASGAASVPLLPAIDPAILRELAAQPQPPDSDGKMDEEDSRADVSHGRSNRNGVTSSSTATGVAGCDGGGRGAEISGAVKCPRCSERFASQPHTPRCGCWTDAAGYRVLLN